MDDRRMEKRRLLIEWCRLIHLKHWSAAIALSKVIINHVQIEDGDFRHLLSKLFNRSNMYWEDYPKYGKSTSHLLWMLVNCDKCPTVFQHLADVRFNAEVGVMIEEMKDVLPEETIQELKLVVGRSKDLPESSTSTGEDTLKRCLLKYDLNVLKILLNAIHDSRKHLRNSVELAYVRSVIHCSKQLECQFLKDSMTVNTDLITKMLSLIQSLPSCSDDNIALVVEAEQILAVASVRGWVPRIALYSYLLCGCNIDTLSCYEKINCDPTLNRGFGSELNMECFLNIDNLFLETATKDTHFLQHVLNLFQVMLDAKDYSTVDTLLTQPQWSVLRPLVVFCGWKNSKNIDESMSVITYLWKNYCSSEENTRNKSVVSSLCDNLFAYSNYAKWCLNKQRDMDSESKTFSRNPANERKLLDDLQQFSALRVFNDQLSIKTINSEEILTVLKNRGFDRHNLPDERYPDIMIFRAYLCMSHVIDAIMTVTETHSVSSANIDADINSSSKSIKYYLLQAKSQLELIYPVTFRAEVLENVFSLLFITQDNICMEYRNGYDHETTETECYGYTTTGISGLEDVTRLSSSYKSFSRSISYVKNTSKSASDHTAYKKNQHKISRSFDNLRLKGHENSDNSTSVDDISFVSSANCSHKIFICSSRFVRIFLSWFKECLVNTTASFYNAKLSKHPDLSSSDSVFVKTSISDHNLQQCLSRLDQCISEAQWRFELVSTEETNNAANLPNKKLQSKMYPPSYCNKYHTQDNLRHHIQETEKSTNNQITEANKNTDAGVHSGSSSEKRKARKWKHPRLSSSNVSSYITPRSNTPIINQMFSSPTSLVNFCLVNGQTGRAKQVIKMFQLHNSPCAKEVYFSEKLQETIRKLKLRSNADRRRNYVTKLCSSKLEALPKINSLRDAVANAAAAGVAATTSTSMVDELLAKVEAPPIVNDIDEATKTNHIFQECCKTDALVIADLSITASLDIDVCNHLMNLASQLIPQKAGGKTSVKFSEIPGFVATFQRFYELMQQKVLLTSSVNESVLMCEGLSTFLTQSFVPLSSDRLSQHCGLWIKLKQLLSEVSSMLSVSNDNSAVVNVSKNSDPRVSFKKLIWACSVSSDKQFIPVPFANEVKVDYLLSMYDYLRQLSSVLKECNEKRKLVKPEGYFSVLQEGPTTTLGRMALKNHVSPDKLETLADKLNLDLRSILTKAVCPDISCSVYDFKDYFSFECIVLNQPDGVEDEDYGHPEVLARQLLIDLTQLMQEVAEMTDYNGYFTFEAAVAMSKNPSFHECIESTKKLACVDLDLLQTREERIGFFVNVTNMMWIHALMYEIGLKNPRIWMRPNDGLSKSYLQSNISLDLLSANTLLNFSCLHSVKYKIGQLSPVSYVELRYGLLRLHMQACKHVPEVLRSIIEESKKVEEWIKYAPPVEVRSLFVLSQGLKNCPKLTILIPDILEEQLDSAMSDYLGHYVHADFDSKQVSIPSLLDDHKEDFCSINDSEAEYAGLVNFIRDNVHSELKDALNILSGLDSMSIYSVYADESGRKELPFSVHVYPQQYKFLYRFSWDSSEESSVFLSESKRTFDRQNSTTLELSAVDVPDAVIDFMRTNCPILAYVIQESSTSSSFYRHPDRFSNFIDAEPLSRFLLKYLQRYEALEFNLSVQLCSLINSFSMIPTFFWETARLFSSQQKWVQLLGLIDDLPYVMKNEYIFSQLRDGVLCMILDCSQKCGNYDSTWCYALQFSNIVLQCEYVSKNLEFWPVDECLHVLQLCIKRNMPVSCREKINRSRKLLSMYREIMLSITEPKTNLLKASQKKQYRNWKDVADASKSSPEDILDILMKDKKFDVARDWCNEHSLPSDIMQIIDEKQICYMLDETLVKPAIICEILEKYTNDHGVLICMHIMKGLNKPESILFIIDYLLGQLRDNLSSSNLVQLSVQKIGLKMLKCIPEDKLEYYVDLTNSSPHLMFEQLLMNSEIEIAEKAFFSISDDIAEIEGLQSDVSRKHFDSLLEKYSLKALDVRIISAKPMKTPIELASLTDASCLERRRSSVSHSAPAEQFIMPLSVPTKQQWIIDDAATTCMICKIERFSMVNRRHHCRRCGRVVCTSCSRHRALVDGYGNIHVRICDECCDQMANPYFSSSMSASPTKASSGSYFERRLKSHLSEAGTSCTSSLGVTKPLNRQQVFFDDTVWVLSIDPNHNSTVRDEFSYDQAPSISLCLSILSLHCEPQKCGSYMLELHDHLSLMLLPIASKQPNPEVDYGLVISMMKSLLLSAKVKFSEADDGVGLERCDVYLRCVALLNVLVRANCNHLIPSEKLTNNETIRWLRDQLIEEERWQLALELSTKAGLDIAGVWAAWGKLCLKTGEFSLGREKFAHCLKVTEKGQGHQSNPLLNSIISQLENSSFQNLNKSSAITKSLENLKKIELSGPQAIANTNTDMNPLVYTECTFYLRLYGSHHHYVHFLVHHNLLEQAIRYILEKKCEDDVFIDSLLIPCVLRTKFQVLLEKIRLVSPNISEMSRYLTSSCRSLEKQGLHNILYVLQVFMQDDIRAAMMCIKFFKQGAKSYTELYNRLDYLNKARHHLNRFLQTHERWNRSDQKNVQKTNEKYCLTLPTKEVNRHLNTVIQQISITKFLKRCEESNPLPKMRQSNADDDIKDDKLYTLFGSNSTKNYLCATILLCGSNVTDGFGTAFQIIQEFKLHAQIVYSLVSKHLVLLDRIQDVFTLLQCVQESGYKDNSAHDDVIFSAIEQSRRHPSDNKVVEELIKNIRNENLMISAYILCEKLTQAYLVAIKKNSASDVQRILSSAEKLGQNKVKYICQKWLSSNNKN